MTEELVIHLSQQALKTTAMLGAPMLVSALLIGLAISVMQAVTQINEATLTFIPKILIVGLVVLIAGPWMIDVITKFTIELLQNITEYVRN